MRNGGELNIHHHFHFQQLVVFIFITPNFVQSLLLAFDRP